jgi:hemerythrin-like domain-containing protein
MVLLPGAPGAPAAGFEQPFEMLAACHDRLRRSLALLQRLQAHVAEHGADRPAREAAADVRRYFTLAAPAHHEDEERHVLPLLAAGGGDRAALAERLRAEHRQMQAQWTALDAQLEQLEAGTPPKAVAFADAVARFVALHEAHLRHEDGVAFPQAAAALAGDVARLQAMGDEMAARRGVR